MGTSRAAGRRRCAPSARYGRVGLGVGRVGRGSPSSQRAETTSSEEARSSAHFMWANHAAAGAWQRLSDTDSRRCRRRNVS